MEKVLKGAPIIAFSILRSIFMVNQHYCFEQLKVKAISCKWSLPYASYTDKTRPASYAAEHEKLTKELLLVAILVSSESSSCWHLVL